MSAEFHNESLANSPSSPTSGAEPCPAPHIWWEVAMGTLPETEARTCLRQAGQCEICSARLRKAANDLDTEESAEESAFLNQLASSSSEGQRRLATVIQDRASLPRRGLQAWVSRPVAIAALAAALLLVACLIGYRALRPASDATLLALVYDKHRLTEMRLPGAKAVPLASPKRDASGSDVSSTELFELKLRTQQRFDKNPNDDALRQTLGRISLVEHDGEAARRRFEMAEALNPLLSGLKLDMADAYFEIAESTGDPLNYARAADLYSQHLDAVHGQDAVALYNRGLCWERQSVLFEAIKDYQAALAIEKDPGWRREIANHLTQVKELDRPSSEADNTKLDLTPADFLQVAARDPRQASEHYERYLDAAMKGWITQHGTSPEADAALTRLAAIGLEHQDAWLHDWLRTPISATGQEADRQLASAIHANAKGDSGVALPRTERAAALYRQTGNNAGNLRARIETAYSLQKMLRGEDCVTSASSLEDDPALDRYSWSRAYLLLELSACNASVGNLPRWIKYAEDGLKVTLKHGLQTQELRARFFVSDAYSLGGKTASSWKMQTSGLARSSIQGSALRSYGFLYGLRQSSEGLNLNWATIALADAAVDAARKSGNTHDLGYALDILGRAQTKVGDFRDADQSFQAAEGLFAQAKDVKSLALYKADLNADRAAFLARQGQLHAATLQMQRSYEFASNGAGTNDSKLHYYPELAHLLRQSGNHAEALRASLLGIDAAELTLAPLRTELQKRSWERRTSNAYQLLVQCLIDSGRIEDALRVWEWHRVATYRHVIPSASNSMNPALPVTAEIPRVPSGQVVVVYARILDHYVAWMVQEGSERRIRLVQLSASPEHIASLSAAFSRLCSDRYSAQGDIAFLGKELYRLLISPFETQIHSASTLRLEVDESLRSIPFAALITPNGRYLVEQHATLLLPMGWSLQAASEGAVTREMHLLAVNGMASSGAVLPTEYDEVQEVANRFEKPTVLHPQDTDTAHLQALLPGTEVFHFSGHASTNSENSGLVLRNEQDFFSSDSIAALTLTRCRLAVLAACETDLAVSNSMEDSANLPHALLRAGVNYVIATQWAIDSRTTHPLMVQFYENLLRRQPIAIAMQTAQKSMLTLSTYHPYYWSAFRTFGE